MSSHCSDCGSKVFTTSESPTGEFQSHYYENGEHWMDARASKEYCLTRQIGTLKAEIDVLRDSNSRLRDVIRNFQHAPIVHQIYEPRQAAEKEPT